MGNWPIELHDLLYYLGVTANYVGYSYLGDAICLCVREPERMQQVTKLVYMEIAHERKTTWKAVERGIRAVGIMIWEGKRPLLEQLTGQTLFQRPCSAQLIAILATCLLHTLSHNRK